MNYRHLRLPASCLGAACLLSSAFATNPLIMDQFTADPAARVFEDRVYVYASHDILATEGKGRAGWFCMEDYHVFSSENLTDWTDHGVIVKQTDVPWANPTAYSMWAPDCIARNGKYYFYFPTAPKEVRGFKIGVAIADHPAGPFTPEPEPIDGIRGIDPCVFIDRDGSPYIYYSMGKIFVARLKDNMRELEGPPAAIDNLPPKGLLEGPMVFERNGIYYLTYPHVEHEIERLEYAIADNPLGPFKQAGVILDEAESGCWTVHHSILEYRGQWYLFYHDKDLSPGFDKARAIRADRIAFNADGTIIKVKPTLRGVGLVDARREIQIDRHSGTSGEGVTVSFLNPEKVQDGWKVALPGPATWVRFNEVDFGKGGLTSIEVRAASESGGTLEIHLDQPDGPLLGSVAIGAGSAWSVVSSAAKGTPAGVHNLVVTQAGGQAVDLDWVRFR